MTTGMVDCYWCEERFAKNDTCLLSPCEHNIYCLRCTVRLLADRPTICQCGDRVDSHAWKWKEEIGPTTWHGGGRSQWVDEVIRYEDALLPPLDETINKFRIFLNKFTQQANIEFIQQPSDKLTTYIITTGKFSYISSTRCLVDSL
jgi:hypothetical protein